MCIRARSRVEYNKFVKALKKDLGDKYVFHCYEKNKKYPVYWPAMKIRLKNTYIREANKFLPNPCTDSDGIFIDVFIYDYMSNNRFLDFILRIINTILMIVLVFFENLGINLIPIKELYRFNAKMYGKLCKNSKYFADEITWTFNPLKPFTYKYSDIDVYKRQVYKYIGKNSVFGILVMFLGITLGHGAGLIFNYNDYLMGNLSQMAANLDVDKTYEFNLLSNIYIMVVSTFIITFIGTLIIERFLIYKFIIKEKIEYQ